MGITGLLPLLEKATKPCHISELRGSTVAVDTYCWLHKGATACYFQLAQGDDSYAYVNYCMKYVKLLQSHGIKPILVFDGKNLPAKAETEAKRRETRNRAKQRATELLRLGKTEEAKTYMKQSINITPEMASAVIKECHKLNVDCIVAPYESDAQLAYFSLNRIADIIITEDSDLLTFGCSKVLYKLDMRGCGYLVEAEKIPIALKVRPEKYTFDKFRYMCMLSGCDYVDSLPGIGLKKALKFITCTEETNPEVFLDRIPRYLNMRHLVVTKEYKESFLLADATFRHQTVFDPLKKKLVPLTDPAVCGTNPAYCKNTGEMYDHDTAYQVALGNLHPSSHKQLNNWAPPQGQVTMKNSIWCGEYKKNNTRKQQTLLDMKKPSAGTSRIETVDLEKMQIEEDSKLEQELQSYFTKTDAPKQIKDPPAEMLSPVLKANPFLKRLSRFPRTVIDEKVVVRSRYFVDSSQIGEHTNGTIDKDMTEESGSSNCITIPDEEEALTPSDSNFSERNSEEVPVGEKVISTSQPNPPKSSTDNSSQKRKVLGPCRSVGLKRTKSEGQKTLHSFFKKLG